MTARKFFISKKDVDNSLESLKKCDQCKKFVDISEILLKSGETCDVTNEELFFCYEILLDTISHLIEGNYSNFDALTTTTCCHGVALLANSLILQAHEIDLNSLLSEGQKRLSDLKKNLDSRPTIWYLPEALIELTRLYLLTVIREFDQERFSRIDRSKLKRFGSLSNRFFYKLVTKLQNYYSNVIADAYFEYFSKMETAVSVCDIPVASWAKYINPNYIRTDRRGRKYAACLFSMQVSLGHLIYTKGKLALINDIRSKDGSILDRHVQLFQGDGISGFEVLSLDKLENYHLDEKEPYIIFGGCSFSKNDDFDSIKLNMEFWKDRLAQFVLASDTRYPQFPRVLEDPEFDRSAITPKEKVLREAISFHSKIPGLTAKDPSLFYLTHIFPASFKQILATINRQPNELPHIFIPKVALED